MGRGEEGLATCPLDSPPDHLAAAPGEERAGVRLVHCPGHVGDADRGEPRLELSATQLLEGDAVGPESVDRTELELSGLARHPEHAAPIQQAHLGLRLELRPELEGPGDKRHVVAPLTVASPDDTGLSAGARPAITRTPGVHQGHVPP